MEGYDNEEHYSLAIADYLKGFQLSGRIQYGCALRAIKLALEQGDLR